MGSDKTTVIGSGCGGWTDRVKTGGRGWTGRTLVRK